MVRRMCNARNMNEMHCRRLCVCVHEVLFGVSFVLVISFILPFQC
jgi:hypothetical protein